MQNPVRQWDLKTISDIMHNMIVEDEHGLSLEHLYERPL